MSQKLDKEHLEEIQELRQKFNATSIELGNLTIEREMLKAQLSSITTRRETLMSQFETLRTQESELFQKLTDRYGDGEIDIEQGIFKPNA
tara:strand:- start:462 stop:731 length:270 start_codon:yes stop_codon:yes gene_type:complete